MIPRAVGTVAVLGSINMDSVFRVSQFAHPGETIMAKSVTLHAGGKGANQAIAAARAGAAVRLIGADGDDAAGRTLLDILIGENIDCSAIAIIEAEPTGIAQIVVDDTGENQIIVVTGTNARATGVPGAEDTVLLAQLELPIDAIASFFRARKSGAIAILNAAPFRPEANPLMALADIVILNEIELTDFCGALHRPSDVTQIVEMARQMQRSPEQTIIVTRGKAGTVAVGPDGVIVTPAEAVPVVDTTGAGDCFCGYMAAMMSTGQSLGASILKANRAAAISVGKLGAGLSCPFYAEL